MAVRKDEMKFEAETTMQKSEKPAEKVVRLWDVEQLRILRGTPAAIFVGTMARMGWRPGKQVTEAEYDTAVAGFEAAAADGGDRK